ncbi:MAG: sulfotransferase domain-containing protein [bacterium]
MTAGISQALKVLKMPVRELRASYRELTGPLRELTGPLRGLPSALIIGAQRSGTTSLFKYLEQHPTVLRPLGKESHYFDLHYGRGVRWYRGRFPFDYRLRSGTMTLDASPYYLLHPLAPERAAQLLPGVKLLAVLRNPVERAFSHYQHEVRKGREALSFADAIDREAERLAGEEERLRSEPGYYSFNHHCYSYTLRGRYVDQLRRWVEHFPRERLMIVQSERMFREPAVVTAAVHQFLGLRPHLLKGYKAFYQGNYERGIPPGLRSRLVDYFEPYNRELYRWLGEEFDWT